MNILSGKITEVAIDELLPAEYNPRKLSNTQYEEIKKSLETFGFVVPAVINKNPDRKNIIVGGHQRVKVWKDMGGEIVPCIFVDLPLAKEKELNVRLNKAQGEWDYSILQNEFDTGDLEQFGFDPDSLNQEFFKVQEETLKDFMVETDYDKLIDGTGDRHKEGQTRSRIVICGFEIVLAEPEAGQLIEYIRTLRLEPEEKRMERSERFIKAVMEVVNERGLSKTGPERDQRKAGPAEENAGGASPIQDRLQQEDNTPSV